MPQTKSITIDGVPVELIDGERQAISINGQQMPLATFFKIAQIAITDTDLRGTDMDGIDPRFKFIAMVRHSGRVDGFGSGAQRIAPARYAHMFTMDSVPPMAR